MKTLKDIIDEVGGSHEVADWLNVRPNTVRVWIHDGYIPEIHRDSFMDLAQSKQAEVSQNDLDSRRT